MAKAPKGAEDPTIKEQIVIFLRRREGEHVTTGEIAGSLGIRRDQATSALHNLAKRSMPDTVRRVGDGVWMYQTPSKLDTRAVDGTFSAVGRLSGDRILLVDLDGNLWEAHRVDDPTE